MSASEASFPTRGLLQGSPSPCKVVLFCEDSQTRGRALRVCERLLERFGEELDFEFNWWKLGRLEDSTSARRATRAAAEADIVMFCTHSGDLPPDLADGLESWAESGTNAEGALVVVSAEAPAPLAELTLSRVERAAQQLGKDFIRLTPEAARVPGLEESSDPLASAFVEADAPQTHVRHWGLNE